MPTTAFTMRLTLAQTKVIEKLSAKLGIDKTNIIRLAIARLAEAEGVLHASDAKKK